MKMKRVLCAGLAALMLTTTVSAAFPDAQNHWAKASIDRWSSYGVVKGGSDGNFAPDQSITRGQMAVILCAVCGWQDVAENTFSDLKGDEWYAPYVLKANAAGAMAGANGMIRPNDPITRQEAAVMMYKALFMESAQGGKTFADQGEIADWALNQVTSMAANGYITGTPDGRFLPKGYITRAETVTILNQAVSGFYNRAGAYSRDCARAVVCAPGVTLQSMTVKGDLIVAPGATGAETTLYNLSVEGRTILQSDRDGLIEAGGKCDFGKMLVLGDGGRVKLSGEVKMDALSVDASDVRITGVPKGTSVTVAEGAEKVYVNGTLMAPGEGKAVKGDDPFVDGPVIDIVVGE